MAIPELASAPRRWFIYVRISRDRDHTKLGVARQEKACREWAERHGDSVLAVFQDNDISAYSGKKRPAYLAMLERLEAGEADGILCWHPDRLHRSPKELESFIDLLDRTGAVVTTVQGGDYDLSTATGRAMARTIGAWARHESEHKSERIRLKVIELREKGEFMTGLRRRPFGYRPITEGKAKLEIDPQEADVIRDLADRYLAGEGLLSLVRSLEERGISTVSGAPWKHSTVRGMLTNPRIAGMHRAMGSERLEPAPWPAIIDVETHHHLVAKARQQGQSGRHSTSRYLLSGIAVCGKCGGPMQATTSHAGRRYFCYNPTCRGVSIMVEPTEAWVRDVVVGAVDARDFGRRLDRAQGRPRGLAEERDRLQARLDTLADMLAAGELDRAGYNRAKAKVQTLLDGLREREAEGASYSPLERWRRGGLGQAWEGLSLDGRRALVGALIERVVIASATPGKPPRFDAGRLSIPPDAWRV